MIDEKKLDNLARIIALASMDIFKGNAYREEERKLARDIWTNGIIVGEEKDRSKTRDEDLEKPETDDVEKSMKENKNVKGCRGCSACPGNLEEYGIAQTDPTKYCPDAYSDRAQYCGNHDNAEIDVLKETGQMTKEEAIGYAMTACRDMWKGDVCKEIETLLTASSEEEKKYTSLIAEERYKDLCEFFKNDEHLIKTILGSRAEFNNWLERMRWNAKKVNELFEENEKLTALLLKQKTDYPFKEGESLFSPKQFINNKEDCPELYSRDIDKTVYDKAWELEKKEEEKEPEVVIGEL